GHARGGAGGGGTEALSSPPPFLPPYGTARTTPLPWCGDPARAGGRGQTAPAGGRETPDTMARRWLGIVGDIRPFSVPADFLPLWHGADNAPAIVRRSCQSP